jgi:FRG domain
MPDGSMRSKFIAKYSVIQSESWQNFKSGILQALFEHKPFQRGPFLFRGQGSSDWPLVSSFDRWFEGPKSAKRKVSEELIKTFEEECAGLAIEREIWTDEPRRLALAQHHGIPTRLLDWTASPYIAAFFAFAGVKARAPKEEDQVAVWCLDTRIADVWSADAGVEVLNVPSYGNERVRNQLGFFTLLKAPFDSLEEYVSHFDEEVAARALRQIRISATEAQRALADLELMGITYSRIYPGIEGSARTAVLRTRRSLD